MMPMICISAEDFQYQSNDCTTTDKISLKGEKFCERLQWPQT